MARTQVRSEQIANEAVQRVNLNSSQVGEAVISKVIAGDYVNLASSTGVDPGTGDVTISLDTGDLMALILALG